MKSWKHSARPRGHHGCRDSQTDARAKTHAGVLEPGLGPAPAGEGRPFPQGSGPPHTARNREPTATSTRGPRDHPLLPAPSQPKLMCPLCLQTRKHQDSWEPVEVPKDQPREWQQFRVKGHIRLCRHRVCHDFSALLLESRSSCSATGKQKKHGCVPIKHPS